ncbi:hypothetical protein M514_00958 [Trichuris suis]|uniref:Uncharacterized protein n=1 Tax=Trichuris suis TaxID=68888 RepID=A0A085NLW2_9BILA|nr:hypothetical protein M513_00958 [Trichuris suis]KFD70458.1 hypothetical protein M514_00958 [Trichuris suis]
MVKLLDQKSDKQIEWKTMAVLLQQLFAGCQQFVLSANALIITENDLFKSVLFDVSGEEHE